jgi:hypothetical protein
MREKRTKTILFVVFLFLLAVPTLAAVPPGRIMVSSTPTGALACIDNATCDTTSTTFTAEGNAWHTVVVTEKGYLAWAEKVFVTSDQTATVSAYLDLDHNATAIRVTLGQGSGKVCLDNGDCRANVGTAGGNSSTFFTGVSPGYHTVSVEGSVDYGDATELVQVTLGKTTDVYIALNPFVTPTTPQASSSTGTVRVYVDRTGSTICIDNVDCFINVGGSSGPGTGTAVFNDVNTDKAHIITVAADGYRSVSTPVTVSKDMITTVDVTLQSVNGPTIIPPLTTTFSATQQPTVPPTMPTARSGLSVLPVLGALALCWAVFLFRNDSE